MDSNNKDILEVEDNLFKDYGIMISGFIHDINNPIAVITGQISILETLQKMQKLDDEKISKVSNKVLTATKKIGSYIELIRGFYKPYESTEKKAGLVHTTKTILQLSQTKIYRSNLNLKFNSSLEEFELSILPKELTLILWNYINFFIDLSILKQSTLSINLKSEEHLAKVEFSIENFIIETSLLESQISLNAVNPLFDAYQITKEQQDSSTLTLSFNK